MTEEVTNRSTVREAGESGAWVGSACAEWRGDGRGEVGLNACTYVHMYVHGHMHARTHTHTHLSTHSHHFPHYTKLKLGLPTRHRNTAIANLTCAHNYFTLSYLQIPPIPLIFFHNSPFPPSHPSPSLLHSLLTLSKVPLRGSASK